MALLISQNRPDAWVWAGDPNAGFTFAEIEQYIGAPGKAFRLSTGGFEIRLPRSMTCGRGAQIRTKGDFDAVMSHPGSKFDFF